MSTHEVSILEFIAMSVTTVLAIGVAGILYFYLRTGTGDDKNE